MACLWHGFQGLILHRGYPYNTFLFQPSLRFTDFTIVVNAAHMRNPYRADGSVYFPLAYSFLRWIRPEKIFMSLFFGTILVGILFLLDISLRPLSENKADEDGIPNVRLVGIPFLLLLYPFWYCLDRGNIEFLLVLLVGAFVYLLARRRYRGALACLVPAICFKIYPAVLLALYLRRGRMRWIVIGLVSAFTLSFLSLASFPGSWHANWQILQKHLAAFNLSHAIGNGSLDGTSTLWNPYKVILGFMHFQTFEGNWDWQAIPHDVLLYHQRIYSVCMAVGAIGVTGYVCFVETELLRRGVLLLIYMVISSPIGADYKLLHAGTALCALILLSTRRHHDLLVVGFLSVALIPMKEWLLPFLGFTDDLFTEVSIGIFLAPLALLLAAGFLMWDGFRQWNPHWGWQRVKNLLSPLRRA